MVFSNLDRIGLASHREPVKVPLTAIVGGIVFALAAVMIGSGRITGYVAGAAIIVLPILAALAVARPYIFPYGLYIILIPFDNILNVGHNGTITKYLGLAAAGALLFCILRTKRAARPPVAVGAWAGYALWVAASIVWAVSPTEATTTALSVAEYVALYAIICVSPIGRASLRYLSFAIIVSGMIAGTYGAWVFHNGMGAQLQQYDRLIISSGDGGGIDANHYANAMLFPALLATMRVLGMRKWFHLGWIIALVPMLAGMYLSASREALVAYGVGLAAIAVLAPRYRRQLVLVALFIIGAAAASPWVWMRFGEALKTGGSGRTAIWHVGFATFQQHWMIGVGVANFHYAYNDAYLSVFQGYHAGWDRVAHNDVLQTGVELGVVGVVALLAAAIATFRSGTASRNDTATADRELDDLRIVSIASLASLAVVAMFIDVLVYKYFWLAICFAAQVRTVARTEARSPIAQRTALSRAFPGLLSPARRAYERVHITP